MSTPFRTLGLIGKYNSPDIVEPLLRLAAYLEARGVRVLLDRLTAGHVGQTAYSVLPLEDVGKQADLAVVIGGDGTMLNIARTFAPFDTALVGVNLGRLGFLTDIPLDAMCETIGLILDGDYSVEERMLLAAQVYSEGERRFEVLAFNDVVVSKGVKGGMIEFDVHIDGQFVYTLRSDGIIVASPTGSTAYALSSGGPILHPSVSVMALVPVCPHTLSNRPIAVASTATIEITMRTAPDALAHFDNHSHFALREEDRLVVRRFDHCTRLLHPPGYSYYHMLREKLHWSETY
ncbi:MAG: NAD kinase [Burkholderiales bacterium]|nr:NAD kinase [Burkholderiales bacterium]